MKITQQAQERHVLNVIVDNEPGILAKITGMFTARGYNIDSLTVADISEDHAISRITIVTRGPEPVIDQIRAQLERLVPAIRDVLEQSIRDGGSTLRDFAQPDGELGYFATRFDVYGREGQACHREDGGTIRRIVQGGRSTWFCPVCQR